MADDHQHKPYPLWHRLQKFIHVSLTPENSLSEIFFGLIMVISITSTVRQATIGSEEAVRVLLLSALGCNTAWGIVDGVLYVLSSVFQRNRQARMLQAVKDAPHPHQAIAVVAKHLDPLLDDVTLPEERQQLYAAIANRASSVAPRATGVLPEDFYGAIASFLLVFLATLPVLFPYLVIHNPSLALRTSNLMGIAMLFIVGYAWAGYTKTNRIKAGIAIMALGSVLVTITVALGG
jgi:VIT1/CCC1 family predicted Fe2+/Mn2+ transporter